MILSHVRTTSWPATWGYRSHRTSAIQPSSADWTDDNPHQKKTQALIFVLTSFSKDNADVDSDRNRDYLRMHAAEFGDRRRP
jgi:hypothetical protein